MEDNQDIIEEKQTREELATRLEKLHESIWEIIEAK